ncbi:MAG: hypothetical protein B7Z10_06075 [Rhodobacterales bacterium 32-66-7]|nr:MAG: hypothetical protein B7Z10_06075 [Rhodobacterales bacterium 32-66-7]
MRFLRRSLTGLMLLAVTLGLLGLAVLIVGGAIRQSLAPGGPAAPPVERVVPANVTLITAANLTPETTAFGKVEARRTLDLRSRQSGTVIWVAETFRNGLSVTEGDVLLRLDPAPATEALELATADLTEARAEAADAVAALELSEADLAAAEEQAVLRQQALVRQEDLAAMGSGSPLAVETAGLAASAARQAVLSRQQALATARARVDQTRVAVTRAEIALGEAERTLSETELRAGLSGRVDGVTLVEGALVGANESLGRIVDPTALDVAVRLSTAQFGRLVLADGALAAGEVTVFAPGSGTPLSGRLDRIGAAVEDGQTGRLVYVALAEDPALATLVQPGDFVTVGIREAPVADAVRLPATALGPNGTLLVLGPEDRLEEQAVTVLRQEGDDVILAVGALAGREVVTERSAVLGAGIRIRPIRPDVADASADFPAEDAVALTPERRAALLAMIDANPSMTAAEKADLVQALQADSVATGVIDRLERPLDG